MKEPGERLDLAQRWLALTRFPRLDAVFLDLKPLGKPVHGLGAHPLNKVGGDLISEELVDQLIQLAGGDLRVN